MYKISGFLSGAKVGLLGSLEKTSPLMYEVHKLSFKEILIYNLPLLLLLAAILGLTVFLLINHAKRKNSGCKERTGE